MLDENRERWAALGTETTTQLAKLGDEARDYLGQYDLGGAWHAEAFRSVIQLAKAAYARTARKGEEHGWEGDGGAVAGAGGNFRPLTVSSDGASSDSGSAMTMGTGSSVVNTTNNNNSSSAATATATATAASTCAWIPAVMKNTLTSWEKFDALALDTQLRLSQRDGSNDDNDEGGDDDAPSSSTGGAGAAVAAAADRPVSSRVLTETVNAAVTRFKLLETLGVSKARGEEGGGRRSIIFIYFSPFSSVYSLELKEAFNRGMHVVS